MKWISAIGAGIIVLGAVILFLTELQLIGGLLVIIGLLMLLGALLMNLVGRQPAHVSQRTAAPVNLSVSDPVEAPVQPVSVVSEPEEERTSTPAAEPVAPKSAPIITLPDDVEPLSLDEASKDSGVTSSAIPEGYTLVNSEEQALSSGMAIIEPAKKKEEPIIPGAGTDPLQVFGTDFTNASEILKNIITDQGGEWNLGGRHKTELKMILVPRPTESDPDTIAVYADYDQPADSENDGPRTGKIGYLPNGHGLQLRQNRLVTGLVDEDHAKFTVKIDVSGL